MTDCLMPWSDDDCENDFLSSVFSICYSSSGLLEVANSYLGAVIPHPTLWADISAISFNTPWGMGERRGRNPLSLLLWLSLLKTTGFRILDLSMHKTCPAHQSCLSSNKNSMWHWFAGSLCCWCMTSMISPW